MKSSTHFVISTGFLLVFTGITLLVDLMFISLLCLTLINVGKDKIFGQLFDKNDDNCSW